MNYEATKLPFNKLNLISYDFKKFSKDDLFDKLKQSYWDPLDFEPIQLYTWINSKCLKKD